METAQEQNHSVPQNMIEGISLSVWLNKSENFRPGDWAQANVDFALRSKIMDSCQNLARLAYEENHQPALAEIHRALAFIYKKDFSIPVLEKVNCETQPILRDIAAALEDRILVNEVSQIPNEAASSYPHEGKRFIRWIKDLVAKHPAGAHPFYHEYLAKDASAADMKFFMAQETNLDPRFDDILALMQIGLHGSAKIEIANNYYDELGNGNPEMVHSTLFGKVLQVLNLDEEYVQNNILLQAQISGNISACLALARRHYYKAIGYFGVTEYLAPMRFRQLIDGWQRIGLPEEGLVYHSLHIPVDARHAQGWFANVIAPLIDQNPSIGYEIALGAIIRLNSSQQYLDELQSFLINRRQLAH